MKNLGFGRLYQIWLGIIHDDDNPAVFSFNQQKIADEFWVFLSKEIKRCNGIENIDWDFVVSAFVNVLTDLDVYLWVSPELLRFVTKACPGSYVFDCLFDAIKLWLTEIVDSLKRKLEKLSEEEKNDIGS